MGDEAVVHGINETEVQHVITTHDLLPKFKKILAQTPTVTTIVYMEDPLKKGETSGFKEGVKIYSFCDVVAMGSRSSKGKLLLAALTLSAYQYNLHWLKALQAPI